MTALSTTKKLLQRPLLKHCYGRNVHTGVQLFTKPQCQPKVLQMAPDCKVGLVTGGAEGIGFSVANHLLKAGCRAVAVTGLNSCNGKDAVTCLNSAYGKNRAMFINSDSCCMVQLEETFKIVKDTYQGIDILVNCAGICDGSRWESEVVTNTIGTIRSTLLGYKYVGKEGSGRGGIIINVTGIGGLEPMPPVPTLCATFHSIVGLSRSFGHSSHFQRSGVRVVCLCVGSTNTNFHKNAKDQGMTETLGQEFVAFLKTKKHQSCDVCGLGAVHLVKYAENGSVFALEASRLFECNLPAWENGAVLEAQYM